MGRRCGRGKGQYASGMKMSAVRRANKRSGQAASKKGAELRGSSTMVLGQEEKTHTQRQRHTHTPPPTHTAPLEVVEKSQRLTLNSDNIFALHGKCRRTKAHRMTAGGSMMKKEEEWEVCGMRWVWRVYWQLGGCRESHKATDNRTRCNRWLL